jgi:hypothetical protein
MLSWLQKQASSPNVQLAATAVLSGAAVIGAMHSLQALRRQAAVEDLKASIPEVNERHHAEQVRSMDGRAFSRSAYGSSAFIEVATNWRK